MEQTFAVLLARKDDVQAALEALAKRFARRGLTLPPWSWGKAYAQGKIERIPLTLTGETPHYAGWTFAAALTHIEGETIVRTLSTEPLPREYRERAPVCDHCKTARRRAETYVLRHEDGRSAQVGSSCLADFLGASSAEKLATAASMIGMASGIAEDGCEGFGGGASENVMLVAYLPIVAWCVRKAGWVSRTQAHDSGGTATADYAMLLLTDRQLAEKHGCIRPSEADAQLAAAAEVWADSLSDETVAQSDYQHSIRVVARLGYVGRKTMGVGASIITAYERHLGRERQRAERAARPERNEHIGTVGKRETWTVTLDFVTGYDTAYGYTTVLKFRTPDGVTLVWKATRTDLARADVGKAYKLTGTVKKHDQYNRQKQTLLSRCRLEEIDERGSTASCSTCKGTGSVGWTMSASGPGLMTCAACGSGSHPLALASASKRAKLTT